MRADSDRPYSIENEIQLRAMTSARRHEIVDTLAVAGPLSIRELAASIGVRASSLYHHVSRLLEVGLILEAGTRVVRRRREQLYVTPARRMRMVRALTENRHTEIMTAIVSAITRQMARDFESGGVLSTKLTEGDERNLGFFRALGRPSPAELAKINANLAEISEILWSSHDAEHPMISLGWVMSPMEAVDG